MSALAVIILAAGEGTRMRSETPKVLHAVAGKPLVRWVLDAVRGLSPDKVCLIVGHKADKVRAALAGDTVRFVTQEQQKGSGHAVAQCAPLLRGHRGDILVLCADTPLITTASLKALIRHHRAGRYAATVLTASFGNPFGYGRIVRRGDGSVEEIVEEKDASPDQRRITEINSGIYCFTSPIVWDMVKKIRPNNAKKEYYLTDVIALLNAANRPVGAFVTEMSHEIMGVNTRVELADAERHVRTAVNHRHMLAGVTIVDPATTYISPAAVIGADTVLYPGTVIEGPAVIGRGCAIGPYTIVRDARVEDNAQVGPFAHLRPGTVLKEGAKVGNFSEVKKAVVGTRSKVNHLSYIGDAVIGADVNIGAGTITCNYDGRHKHETRIGDRVFVGSNTNLVAPVTVGADALIAAGSTITENTPARSLAIARARQVNKAGYRRSKK